MKTSCKLKELKITLQSFEAEISPERREDPVCLICEHFPPYLCPFNNGTLSTPFSFLMRFLFKPENGWSGNSRGQEFAPTASSEITFGFIRNSILLFNSRGEFSSQKSCCCNPKCRRSAMNIFPLLENGNLLQRGNNLL